MTGRIVQAGDIPIRGAFVASGLGATGLTVTVDVLRLRSGSYSEIVSGAAASEIGDGFYGYTILSANVAAGDEFAYAFKTSGTADQKHVMGEVRVEANYTTTVAGRIDASLSTIAGYLDTEITAILAAVDTEVAAIKTQTDKLTFDGSNRVSANVTAMAADVLTASALATDAVNEIKAALQALGVTVTSPVDSSGRIEIIKGATYDQDDGYAINITLSGAPSITGATVVMKLYDVDDNELTTLTGSAASSTVARFELTATESGAIAGGQYRYYLFITLSGGNIIVPASGYFEVDDPADA